MEIRNCISELLSEHDCVIIPGFGGFIGNYAPAGIDPVNHTFHPPSKQLLFNINLRHNDGLLATRVSTSLGVSYTDGCNLVEDFAEECLKSLNVGESLHFSRVGRLFAGAEGNIQFEQHKTANLLPESFGLTTFISPPVSRQASKGNIRRKKVVQQNEIKKRLIIPGFLRWAAILALPLGIAAIIGVLQHDKISAKYANNAGILNSVFSRFSSASLFEKKTVPIQKTSISKNSVAITPTAMKTEQVSPDQPVNADTPTSATIENQVSANSFAVIIGAFRLKENAEKLIQDLISRGIEASVYDRTKTGLYRVAMGTFSQREEALQLLASAQSSEFKGAWLLTKQGDQWQRKN
ncbi:MAG: SPOR domain-containing protein [Bacteroidota bacterium]